MCVPDAFCLQMALFKGKTTDPNKPKRPMTAYFIFLSDFRVKMKNRGVDHKEILRLGMWYLCTAFISWKCTVEQSPETGS